MDISKALKSQKGGKIKKATNKIFIFILIMTLIGGCENPFGDKSFVDKGYTGSSTENGGSSPGNTAPTISSIVDQNITENTSTAALSFTINDVEDSLDCSTNMSMSSSNATLIENTDVVFGGTAPNCTVTFTPNTNEVGSATLTLTVNDGSLNSQTTLDISSNRELVLNSGSYEFTNGSQAVDCDAYINSPHYNNEGDATYWVDPDGVGGIIAMEAQCDMTEDSGGWTLILNYVHQGGTNPALDVRVSDLPLIKSSTLGDDEGGDATSWGHTGNSLVSEFTFSEIRFYCASGGHPRVVNFKTSLLGGISYMRTGGGNFSGIDSSFTTLTGHSSSIPGSASSNFPNQGNQALTSFSFFAPAASHWGIRGLGDRWECDDFPAGPAVNTVHRVWIR